MNTKNETKLNKLMAWLTTLNADHTGYFGADRYDMDNSTLYVEHRQHWKRIVATGDKARALCELVLGQSDTATLSGYTTWALSGHKTDNYEA